MNPKQPDDPMARDPVECGKTENRVREYLQRRIAKPGNDSRYHPVLQITYNPFSKWKNRDTDNRRSSEFTAGSTCSGDPPRIRIADNRCATPLPCP